MSTQSMNNLFEDTFKTYKNKTALTFFKNGALETQLTYSQLYYDITRFTDFLSKYDLKKGDRVILMLEKSIINIVAYFALLKKGVIVVPINPGFKKNELEYLFNDAKAELILVDSKKEELIKSINSKTKCFVISTRKPYQKIDFFRSEATVSQAIDVTASDPAIIIYTSGTTGNPKGAVLTHGNLIYDAKNIISIWNISKTDVLCHVLPLFHIHGLCFALHTTLLAGAHVIMLENFSPKTVLQRLLSKASSDKCTVFMAVPAMYTKLMDFIGDHQQYDFSHIRLLTCGSAPLMEKEFKRIKKIFKKEPVEREGMSETGMNFSNPLNHKKKPGSIGIALPGVEVRIVNLKYGEDVKPGQIGEIWLKSPSIIKEYWQKPIETKQAFKGGWFRTGDLGKIDSDGYYYLTDRIKHIIISGGENISAKEVEIIINNIKGVIESSVVGLPDEIWGEKVVALVQKDPKFELNESQIKSKCKEKLHDWKCPKKIIFTNHIPKNTMGKVLKEKVKEIFINN